MIEKKTYKPEIPEITKKIESGQSLLIDYKKISVKIPLNVLKKLLNLLK